MKKFFIRLGVFFLILIVLFVVLLVTLGYIYRPKPFMYKIINKTSAAVTTEEKKRITVEYMSKNDFYHSKYKDRYMENCPSFASRKTNTWDYKKYYTEIEYVEFLRKYGMAAHNKACAKTKENVKNFTKSVVAEAGTTITGKELRKKALALEKEYFAKQKAVDDNFDKVLNSFITFDIKEKIARHAMDVGFEDMGVLPQKFGTMCMADVDKKILPAKDYVFNVFLGTFDGNPTPKDFENRLSDMGDVIAAANERCVVVSLILGKIIDNGVLDRSNGKIYFDAAMTHTKELGEKYHNLTGTQMGEMTLKKVDEINKSFLNMHNNATPTIKVSK
ncbi:hypothetical protein AAIR98_000441 [Elusimicrobium simillimum]|uniref:hypothetical protein n=1 Tax=Elusimicrobium simillimum TaxID=3143438 RepID=UPI003C6EF610